MDYNKELLWEENFVGQKSAALDPSIWNLDLGDGSHIGLVGWGNNEREFYTADSITIDGALTISAQRQPADNPIQAYYGPAEWTSGKMHTANKVGFTYGLLEIKAKMPQGQGTWPALWLLGSSLVHGTSWPQCGEIDIFEGTGAHPYQVQGTIHGDGYFGENGLTQIKVLALSLLKMAAKMFLFIFLPFRTAVSKLWQRDSQCVSLLKPALKALLR